MSDPARADRSAPIGSALLVLLTLAAFFPLLADRGFAFLNLDDTRYIVDNPQVRSGLTRENVAWALTSLQQSNWHPLTWMSWQLDASLYGVAAWGFHLTNVILHAANAALVFLVLHRATGARGRSFVVAALFAVHPLHVESVVWVSERKDVLSTFFALLAMRAYLAYAARPNVARYLLVAGLFALGLMAKSMIVTLPGLLLLLDGWPLGRLTTSTLPRRLAEKVPLLALSLGASWLTIQAQEGMMDALPPLPPAARFGNALVYYVTYIGRMLWPVGLTPFHPNPGVAIGGLPTIGAALALAAIATLAWRTRATRPYLLVGWLWFLWGLLPVIGLVQVGFLATADHYTYVPLIGLFVMLVWSFHEAWATRRWPRIVPALAAAVIVAACASDSRRELAHWRDDVTIWQHIVDAEPRSAFAQAYLGRSLETAGRPAEAEPHFLTARELDPSWRERLARGLALEQSGDMWGARRELEGVLMIAPHDVIALEHLARQFQGRGEIADALRHYETLARIQPRVASHEHNLGLLYAQQGAFEEARLHWLRALAIDPTLEEARRCLDAPPTCAARADPDPASAPRP